MQEMKVGPASGAEYLLRRQQGQKMKLKEKFVEIYDMFLTGQDPAQGKDPEAFWDELFLIKVNEEYLASSLRQLSEDQLLAIKDGINSIFLHAVQTMRDPMPQRRLHAMQTLTVVLGEIFRKKFHNWSFDVIHLLTGLSHADLVFRTLLQELCTILDSEESLHMQVVALRLAIALACGNDNVNKNSLNEYFMQKDIFPSLIKFFVKVNSIELAFEAMSLLGLLANYNKYETQNRYLASLAALNDDVILLKMAMVITHTCDKMRKSYTEVMDDDEQSTVSKLTSAFSYVTGMLWNPKSQDISVTDEEFARLPDGRVTVLLVFYDLIYTNKRFLRVFLNYSTSSTPGAGQVDTTGQQPNLEVSETGLGAFLSFSSYLLQHNRTHRSSPYTHLCLIILLILVEDSASYPHLCNIPQSQDPAFATAANAAATTFGANAPSSTDVIRLCRQRQPVLPKFKGPVPMAAALLDVILGFLKHNMKKKMQIDCFRIAVAIIFNMAARFKALRVRLPYHWVEMWNTLQGLVKFLQANAKAFQSQPEARDLVAETIDLVNYFVTFGDMIMPDPASLYALYYEIVRSGIDPFSDLAKEFSISVQPPLPAPLPHHDLTSRNRLNLASSPVSSPPESVIGSPPPPGSVSVLGSPPPSPYHPNPHLRSASPNNSHHHHQQRVIILSLSNINQVYTFFFSHLLAWRDANPTRSLGPDLVSTIIKDHYQDLTLVPNTLDSFLAMRQNGTAGLGGGRNGGGYGNGASGLSTHSSVGSSPVNGLGPHPAWDGYTEVPGKVYFFRQLTRWIVSDFRSISRQNASAVALSSISKAAS
ncbi:DUF1741-domain-containing protein [Linnemannia elongata AG-77]|uniref:DUF1741-domain-containing protein n=1 Tax=Linnemannia elongata AG-77 TaxID=1314771 RepID=A0A197KH88_9FUNG|nr:DUF1741-domain-containing protein [Linnemannia elongata AG-77]